MTPRLALPPITFSRPAPQPRRRSRSWLGSLCIAASLGAHAILLAWVMPESNPAPQPVEIVDKAPPPLEEVAITVLPKPAVETAPPAPAIALPAASPTPVIPSAPAVPIAVASPVPQPTAVEPEPTPVVPPAPVEPPPPAPPSPYATFPHLDGAQATCEGLGDCWRSPVSSSWRSAASDLQARLESQGYTLDNVTGELDSGVRVYAVSKPGEPGYYLNLVSVREGVLYTMTAEPLTLEQVLTLQRS